MYLIKAFSAFNKLQGCKEPSKMINVEFFGTYQIFLDRSKESTQIKHNCVKTFDVRHNAKHFRESQGITVHFKMQFFSIIIFLNHSKFYDEERNELS